MNGVKHRARPFRLMPFFILLLVGTLLFSEAHGQEREQSAEDAPPLEFRELHPDARRLIVDEVRLQLQAEDQRRWEELSDRAETWVGIGSGAIAALGALLALLGWRGLAGLRTDIRRDLVDYVRSDERFQQELEAKLSSASQAAAFQVLEKGRREISLARLEFLARKVAEADGFSNAERDSMKALLLSVKDDPDITRTKNFELAAYQVIRSLYGADLDGHIDELEAEYRDVFVTLVPICGQLVDSYGERLLETDAPSQDLHLRFERYASALKNLNARPWWAPWRLASLAHHKPEGWSKRFDLMLREINHFDDEDKQWLIEFIRARAERPPEKMKTFRQEREKELFAALYSQNRDKLESACKTK